MSFDSWKGKVRNVRGKSAADGGTPLQIATLEWLRQDGHWSSEEVLLEKGWGGDAGTGMAPYVEDTIKGLTPHVPAERLDEFLPLLDPAIRTWVELQHYGFLREGKRAFLMLNAVTYVLQKHYAHNELVVAQLKKLEKYDVSEPYHFIPDNLQIVYDLARDADEWPLGEASVMRSAYEVYWGAMGNPRSACAWFGNFLAATKNPKAWDIGFNLLKAMVEV